MKNFKKSCQLSGLGWVPPEAGSETRVQRWVVYLGSHLRAHSWESRRERREGMMHRWHAQEFQVLSVLEPALRMKAQVRKILFVEKGRERLHIGECRGTWKPVIRWSRGSGWGVGFIAFLHCLIVEMPFRCKQAFPREEKCLLDHLSPFGTSCSLSFRDRRRVREDALRNR
jgi:hypothetical protein